MYTVEGFCRAMALNEALFGQTETSLNQLMEELGINLDFPFENFRLCLTGLSRSKYRGRLHMSRPRYQQILHPLVEEMLTWAEENRLMARYTVVHYNGSKQICFFLREGENAGVSAKDFAEVVAWRFEAKYREIEGYEASGLANFTVLSELIPNYACIPEAFLELQKLERFSFFCMEPGVFTSKMLWSQTVEPGELYERTERIGGLLQKEEQNALEAEIHQLFSEVLKANMDFKGCNMVIYELNRMAYKLCELFLPVEGGEQWERLFAEDFVSVEQLERASVERLRQLQKEVVLFKGYKRNPLTLRAARWLMGNYTQSIGLQETAHYLGVSSAYLSRTFSRDMGKPLSVYLMELRLEHAERLLINSNMKISLVAEQSGFHDSEYFRTLFQKKNGLSPKKYREKYGIKQPGTEQIVE